MGAKLEAFRRWLAGMSHADTLAGGPATARARTAAEPALPERIGRYRVRGRIGQGGMGVVYEARDETLNRPLAIKTFTAPLGDDQARRRFLREARAAAGLNHPNVCQIYDLGEEAGRLYLVMERLEGESLEARLGRGALPLGEAVGVALGILAALEALHARGVVHRDLKPSNVFLTPHGVKVLDFGLARPFGALSGDEASGGLTRSGTIVGTPRYMAPEQVRGEAVDERTDAFATGAILFEMLAGRPAFEGETVVEILYATLHEQPPALSGSPAVARVDRIARRGLAKDPGERPPTAAAMAAELRAVPLGDSGAQAATARPLTRLIVLPFRILRPDADTDFLAFSLPDALTASLAGFEEMVVRSTAAAARFSPEALDLEALASEADVDLVVTGTIVRGGEELQVTVQLTEVPAGTLVWSHSARAPLRDIFPLQDDLVRRVLESLSAPLAREERGRRRGDVPRSAAAYELYLRANQLSLRYDQIPLARDLYLRCLDEDPDFAPAWAQLARCQRVIAKWLDRTPENRAKAGAALERALVLNPDLSVAHTLLAYVEAESGRAQAAMVRLLGRARARRSDPGSFVGLVHSLRYCGLLEASMAAHEEARRLDPHVPTSVLNTAWALGDYDRIVREAVAEDDLDTRVMALVMLGRHDEARAGLARLSLPSEPEAYRFMARAFEALLDARPFEDKDRAGELAEASDDPEGTLFWGRFVAKFGSPGQALHCVRKAVLGGYTVPRLLEADPWLAPVREEPAFADVLARAAAATTAAGAAFRAAGGEELFGVSEG